jgi:NadR type nicotinamide-nucleotide adenylyltransferase
MQSVKKIVVIGPESTGKSTLCELLANYFETAWVPEYARQYLLTNGMNYTYSDLLSIAREQVRSEDAIVGSIEPNMHQVFIDTDMYVMKVWCEFVFGKCHQWILDQISNRVYDMYLLCNNDLPWVKDELREYPDLETRDRLFHIYKDLLINQSTPWVEIKGNPEQRFQTALGAIARL